jgi:hypothetical protein
MPPEPDAAEGVRRALRRVQLGVMGVLAVCALVVWTSPEPPEPADLGTTDRRFTLAALALGVGSVVARRQAASPRLDALLRVRLGLAALLLAGGIGLLATALARLEGDREAALLFVLGGAILALRPPAPLAAPGTPP